MAQSPDAFVYNATLDRIVDGDIFDCILDLVRGQGYPGGPVIASFDSRGKEKISKYLYIW